jgi:hypothetical protein
LNRNKSEDLPCKLTDFTPTENGRDTDGLLAYIFIWAVNSKGQKVSLPGVDFIKIYTGVNQENGWLGECSTEISGVEDLHILGVDIDSRK